MEILLRFNKFKEIPLRKYYKIKEKFSFHLCIKSINFSRRLYYLSNSYHKERKKNQKIEKNNINNKNCEEYIPYQ